MILDVSRSISKRLADRPIARQFSGLTGGRVVGAAFAFLWLAFLARRLPLVEFADLVLLLSVGAMLSVVADWGFPIVLNEAVALAPARGRATLVAVLARRMALAIVASVATGILYLLAANDRSLIIPGVYAVSLIASAWYTSCSAALRGAGWIGPEAVNEVAARLLVLLVGVPLVVNGGGLVVVVLTYAAADAISAIALTIVCWRRLGTGDVADLARLNWRRLAPLGLAALSGVVYYRIDVWLLALMASAGEVAHYSVCYRLLDALVLPGGVLAMISIASTTRLDHAAAVQSTDRLARLLCTGLIPAVLILEAFPGSLLRLAFGASYADAAPVLRILALAVLPSAAGLVWSPLVALRGRGLLAISAGSLAVNVALNLLLISRMGAEGAAVATVIGQIGFAGLIRLSLRMRSA